ncbi:peptidase inhibitor family I36 protein [Streptomyces sp. WAC01526]|uniref:peptidase inhibitor family I36 protein n=1 Tax=Streptomyces sp. WAC01526 TaxID=2588709 RepID=UPI001651D1FE|nr:peptidase inhibitor family I36 protein [Streptomyces sp. WAC01526]
MRIRAIAALGVGISALTVGAIVPASADSSADTTTRTHQTRAVTEGPAEIQATKFTLYRHDNYKGGHCSLKKSDKDLRNNDWIGAKNACNNGASSMKNKTGHAVVLYDKKGYHGRTYYAKAHSSDSDLTNNGFDNKASAVRFR